MNNLISVVTFPKCFRPTDEILTKKPSLMKKLTCILVISLTIILSNNVQASVLTGFKSNKDFTHSFDDLIEVKDTINSSQDTTKTDTTKINLNEKKITITSDENSSSIDVKREGKKDTLEPDDESDFDFAFEAEKDNFDIHWAGFEFGINNYLNNDFSMNLSEENGYMELNTSKSWNINLNIIEYDVPIIKEKFGIGTGLGFEFNDYRFNNRSPIKKANNEIIEDTSYNNYNAEKAKLTTSYITVPILFEYQTQADDDNKFFITAGIIGGIKIGSHTKIVYYNEEGDRNKEKVRGNFYLSPLRYGYSLKMGYGFLKLFANYYETPLFQKDKGAQLHPFTVGFSISF